MNPRIPDEATLTDFLRRSGEVLEVLEHTDVELKRRDGADVVLTTAERQRALRDAIRILAAAKADGETHQVAWLALVPDRARFLADLAEAAVLWAELGTTAPLQRVLAEAKRTASERAMGRTRRRPVSVPRDVKKRGGARRRSVTLPLHVRWSGRPVEYSLADPVHLRRVYEQVLREGTEDDVRRYIDLETLDRLWPELVLPRHVRRAWAAKLKR